jgi:hypothetical protein
MSSKTDVNRRVLAIQAKKKRKNPKARGKPAAEAGLNTSSASASNNSSNVALTSRRSGDVTAIISRPGVNLMIYFWQTLGIVL